MTFAIVVIVVIVGSDCQLAQTDRPTMSLIELSWTAKKAHNIFRERPETDLSKLEANFEIQLIRRRQLKHVSYHRKSEI